MWGSLFGGGSAAQARKDAPKKAILGLRTQLEMLQKREKYLMSQIEDQEAIAKKNISSNKTAAKTALKRKKLHENSLEQTSAQITMLESNIYSIEAANINQETLNAMKNANAAMATIHKGTTIETVDDIMERLGEHKALNDEIANAIANGPQSGEAIDEVDLEEEMARLEQEKLDEDLLRTGPMPSLPSAGKTELRAPVRQQVEEEDDEEAELRKLQAEMAM